jgi:hypothetical protein
MKDKKCKKCWCLIPQCQVLCKDCEEKAKPRFDREDLYTSHPMNC